MPKLPEGIEKTLSDAEVAAALHEWRLWAHPYQLPPPGDWSTWLLYGGRGAGKTRAGAEIVHEWAKDPAQRIGLVAPTAADARDVMVEGESGILATQKPWNAVEYAPSKRRVTWASGARATVYSADEPDRLNGPQHTRLWCDECGVWQYLDEALDMAYFGLRLGGDPRMIITTTPKARKRLKSIMDDPHTVVTHATTYENMANLARPFREQILQRYEGTRLGRQEIHGEYLTDILGALWSREMIRYDTPEPVRIVVAIDPAVTTGDDSDSTGIVVAARTASGYVVLDDRTCDMSPGGWAAEAVGAYHEYGADRIIGEVNNGGDMVEAVIRQVDPSVSYRAVRASRGKRARAEPVAALYEQRKVVHAKPMPDLEDQMVNFTADMQESPDRVDALVWAITELMSPISTPQARRL